MAGIDLGFSGPPTRGASTSANAAAGVSVELIPQIGLLQGPLNAFTTENNCVVHFPQS